MKVAILSPNNYNEAETFVQNHIKNLPFEVVVIYSGVFPYVSGNYLPTNTSKRIHKLKRKLGLTTLTYKESQLEHILKNENIDIVFAEYLITGAETVGICEKLNIPIITIALGYEISMYHILKKYDKKYRKLFSYAKNIMVVSNHMRKNIESLGCTPDKIIYTPAGPSEDFFNILPKFKSKQIVAVGRFVDKKAPHLTILAFKKVIETVSDATLVMAGDGELLAACKDLVNAFGLKNYVQFIGRINRKEHQELLANSYLFVQHSKIANSGDSEGTPVAILEASAAGLPIVSTMHAGIQDVVIDSETGFLVLENDVEFMAKRMIELLQDKDKAIEFGKKGRRFIKENFTLENHLSIISKCIKTV